MHKYWKSSLIDLCLEHLYLFETEWDQNTLVWFTCDVMLELAWPLQSYNSAHFCVILLQEQQPKHK